MSALLNYQAAAAKLGIPLGTLRSLVSRKQVPHVRVTARLVLFELDAIEAWLTSRRVAAGGAR